MAEKGIEKIFPYDHIIFDIRPLQNVAQCERPLNRILYSLIVSVPTWIHEHARVSIYADWGIPLPTSLESTNLNIIYSPPFRKEPVLIIAQFENVFPPLSALIEKRLQNFVSSLLIYDDKQAPNSARGLEHQRTQFVKVPQMVIASASTVSTGRLSTAPMESFVALEETQISVLFQDGRPLILVDGQLANDLDFMRALRGTNRSLGARVVVLGKRLQETTSEFLYLYPSFPMLMRLVKDASLTLVSASASPLAVSESEVISFGGRVLAVEGAFDINQFFSSFDLPAVTKRQPDSVDASMLWSQITNSLPQPVEFNVDRRPRLALMSPMFPQHGGPPHSSLDLLLALSDLVDVDVWTDAEMIPAHRVKARAVNRLDRAFDPLSYDAVVYVLGNHSMYSTIYEHMKVHGGALILHDAQMLDFLHHELGRETLQKVLEAELGRALSEKMLTEFFSNRDKLPRPFLREIVRHASLVITHSPIAQTIIQDLYGIETFYMPVGMPYPFKSEEITPSERRQAKSALGIDLTRLCVISFGEVHMSKGAKDCLYVVKELVEWGYDFQFLFVGPVDEGLRKHLLSMAADFGISDYVRLTGKVSEAQYIQYLQAGDIVLQIRRIPFGQVSGALLDAVSAGMHGVASENLAASIEAPAFIRRVNDYGSPFLYAEAVAKLVDSRLYEKRPEPGWDEFIDKHAFSRYAKNLLSLLVQGRGY